MKANSGSMAEGLTVFSALIALTLALGACAAPAPTPNVQGTVQAAFAATAQAQGTLQGAVSTAVAATRAAATPAAPLLPTATPIPTASPAAPPSPTPQPTGATTPEGRSLAVTLTLPVASAVWAVAYSPDGRRVAAGSADGQVWAWDALTGKALQGFPGHRGGVSGVAFSSDGKLLATSGQDATVRLWDATSGQELRRFTQHTAWVNSVVFGPGDAWLLTGSDDRTARILDVKSGAEVRRIAADFGVNQAALSADGAKALLAGVTPSRTEGRLAVHVVATGESLFTTKSNYASAFTTVAASPDGRKLAIAGTPGIVGNPPITVLDASTFQTLTEIPLYSRRTLRLAFSNDSRTIASCDESGTVVLKDVASGETINVFPIFGDEYYRTSVCSVAFSPDGRQLAATGNKSGVVNIWNVVSER